jgi:hypothetical protein
LEADAAALWPDCPEQDHARDMADILGDPEFNAAFLAHAPDGLPVGFLEVSIRLTAEGCLPGRIGYLEGWYVEPVAGQGWCTTPKSPGPGPRLRDGVGCVCGNQTMPPPNALATRRSPLAHSAKS